METDIKFEDFSPWHHLIFVEELAVDLGNNSVCRVCHKQVLGPVYKCLECDFIQHQSCPEPTKARKGKSRHSLEDRHHLISIKEMEDNGEEEVACRGCEESSAPMYKCSIPRCPFLLHKSCAQLSLAVQHPMLPNDLLTLREPSDSNRCDGCRKTCSKLLFYRNSLRDFDMHMECLHRWRTNADDCHEHVVNPTKGPILFTCEGCGEKSQDTAYLCSVCRLLTHKKCVAFEQTIKIEGHNHFLIRTYSVYRVKEKNKIFCNICRNKVNLNYGAYYCQDCEYIIHLRCSRPFELQSRDLDNPTSDFVYLVEGTNAVEDKSAGPQQIPHFSHPEHDLIISYEELRDDKHCEVCIQPIIIAPFYGCEQCRFFLHCKCANIPQIVKRGLFHKHSLVLLSQQLYNELSSYKFFKCRYCLRDRQGFTYNCGECENYQIDVQCLLIPERLEHQLHEHTVFLAALDDTTTCDGCDFPYSRLGRKFKCTECKFCLCFRCVTLPLVAWHSLDDHLLRLTLRRNKDSNEDYCLICEKELDSRFHFYNCEECDFIAHSHCVLGKNPCTKLGRPCIEKLYHKHPLVFVESTEDTPPCNICHKSFAIDGHFWFDRPQNLALECTLCRLIIHYNCRHHLWRLRTRIVQRISNFWGFANDKDKDMRRTNSWTESLVDLKLSEHEY